jgi:hypothetical protein
MGGHFKQALALESSFANQRDIAHSQVSQTAMNQFGGPARGTSREVTRFEHYRFQTRKGRMSRHSGAGDTTTNHGNVERGVRDFVQISFQ